jgi:tetratricopeptide (TPR) repeat protein
MGTFLIASGKAAEAEPYFKAIVDKVKSEDAQIALADYYLAMKKHDQASAILKPLTQSKKSFEPATLRLAAIEAVQNNNRPRALEMVHQILAKSPKYVAARIFEMRINLVDAKTDEVIRLANAIVKDEPNSTAAAEALQAIGIIQMTRDQTEEATKSLEEALRIDPRSIPTLLSLAQVQLQNGNADKAEQYARQVLQIQPQNPAARAVTVRALIVKGDNARASAELATLEKEYPKAVAVMNLVAARDLVSGRMDAARAGYAKVLAIDAANIEALEGACAVDLRTNRKKDAVDRVEAALKRAAPSASLYMLAARVNQAAGNDARTEELLKQAIESDPARLNSYLMLGQLYISQKRLSDARDQFQTLVAKSPRSVGTNTMLGMLMEAQHDGPAAEKQYLQTLAIDQEAAVAANNLAWIYVSSNRNLDKAVELGQVAVRKLPDEPHVNDTLGWAYYKKGMYSQSVRHLEQSVAKDGSDPSVHYHLGMAYSQIGEFDRAKKSLQKALSMNPSFDGADEARKTLASLGK